MGDVIALPHQRRLKKEQANVFRRLAFEFKLSDEVRSELDNVLYRLTEPQSDERWLFMKISPSQFLFVTKAIRKCRNVSTTFAVWNAALTYMRFDTGEILATREQLAQEVDTAPQNISTAMSDLERIGAILKKRRGQRVVYFVNPNVGWNGGEGSRIEAAKEAPKLRLVSDRSVEAKEYDDT